MIIHKGQFLTSVYPWPRLDEGKNKVVDKLGVGTVYNNRFFLKIPKVCTSFYRDCLTKFEETYDPNRQSIIILRDPVERWISGTLEIFSKFDININLFKRRYINSIAFDRHTAPQTLFIPNNLNVKNCVFYKYNPNIIKEIQPAYFADVEPVIRNPTNVNSKKLENLDLVKQWAYGPDFNKKLKEYYKQDYTLIERYCNE